MADLLEQLNSALQAKADMEQQQRSVIGSRDNLQAALDALTDDLLRQETEDEAAQQSARRDELSNEAKVRTSTSYLIRTLILTRYRTRTLTLV